MKNDEIKAFIKIIGFDFDPDEISLFLNLQPIKAWKKGEKRHPKSHLLHEFNGWMYLSKLSPDASVPDQIKDLMETINPIKEKLIQISKQADIVFYCSIYSEHGRPDLHLDKDIITFASEINSEIDIDMYVISEE